MGKRVEKMKIAVIASYAPSLVIFRGPLLTAMLNAGHEVLACAPGMDEGVCQALLKMGVKYHSISLSRNGVNPLHDASTVYGLYRVFRQFKPDVALGYTVKPVVYGSLAARLAGVPRYFSMITGLGSAFVEPENAADRYLKRRVLNWLIKLLYRLALPSNTAVFFQNVDDKAFLVQLGLVTEEKAIVVNGSGVDLDHFAETPPPAREYPSFLLIARLIKDKGIVEYVEAATILKKKYPGTAFRLLGWFDENSPSGITRSQLEQWQHEGCIEYLGSTDDVRPYMQEASVYVLPTFYREGTPRTVLEAMATGRPIVTTDTPGCRETVIDGENGFLVPVRNVPALVNALEKFICQPGLIASMGKRSREIAVEKYDVHKVNAQIMKTMGLNVDRVSPG
jgi:glycosyltransferase involved in cell wall biosynthesis